jgi:deazaflavin-dependent oxidoreductase (nitroreductase family)
LAQPAFTVIACLSSMDEVHNPNAGPFAREAKDAFVRFWSKLHEVAFEVTEGKVLSRVLGMTAVRLTTTGRKSGLPRSTMLTAPVAEEDRIVLVASNGGDARDPQWFANVLACPDVSVTCDGVVRTMRARVATGPERAELWKRILEVAEVYERYRRRTDREIPVVVLESSRSWDRATKRREDA